MTPALLPEEIRDLAKIVRSSDDEARLAAADSLESILLRLAAKQDKYEDLLNSFFQMAHAESPEQLTRLIINAARRVTGAEAATLFHFTPEDNTLKFSSLAGGADELASQTIPATAGIAGQVLASGETRIVNDTAAHPDFFAGTDKKTGFSTRQILAVPVFAAQSAGRVIGVIEALNKTAGNFDEEDAALLAVLAQIIAVAYRLHRLI